MYRYFWNGNYQGAEDFKHLKNVIKIPYKIERVNFNLLKIHSFMRSNYLHYRNYEAALYKLLPPEWFNMPRETERLLPFLYHHPACTATLPPSGKLPQLKPDLRLFGDSCELKISFHYMLITGGYCCISASCSVAWSQLMLRSRGQSVGAKAWWLPWAILWA
jgi:hypothetical protein